MATKPKYGKDYTVHKIPINDPYLINYEIHGNGGRYDLFWATSRSDALKRAREIVNAYWDVPAYWADVATDES